MLCKIVLHNSPIYNELEKYLKYSPKSKYSPVFPQVGFFLTFLCFPLKVCLHTYFPYLPEIHTRPYFQFFTLKIVGIANEKIGFKGAHIWGKGM